MFKRIITVVAVAAMLATAVPAFANGSIHHNTFEGGNAAASATGGSASANSTNVNVNSNQQGQNQGQQQGQHQSQVGVNVQGQKQDASNKGVSQSVKFESSMIPGVAVAPGLAAGGSQVCLGSFSVGLSGPMAGVAFGKTVVDQGCEDRQNAILLYNMGFHDEALHLLMGNSRVKALFVPAVKPVDDAKPALRGDDAPPAARVSESVQSN